MTLVTKIYSMDLFFKQVGHSRPLFLYFCLFYSTIGRYWWIKICWLRVLNLGSLVSEATALPTEPPPLPIMMTSLHTLLTKIYRTDAFDRFRRNVCWMEFSAPISFRFFQRKARIEKREKRPKNLQRIFTNTPPNPCPTRPSWAL